MKINALAITQLSELIVRESKGEDLGIYDNTNEAYKGQQITFFAGIRDNTEKLISKMYCVRWLRVNYNMSLEEGVHHVNMMMQTNSSISNWFQLKPISCNPKENHA